VRAFAESYGIEKSAVSDHFVRVSRGKLGGLLERPLDKLKLCVLYIDGIEFKGQHLIVPQDWESTSRKSASHCFPITKVCRTTSPVAPTAVGKDGDENRWNRAS
jgi:hypothetical protein